MSKVNTAFKLGKNGFQETFEVFVDIRIRKPRDMIAACFEVKRPLPITSDLAICRMSCTINLDHQLGI